MHFRSLLHVCKGAKAILNLYKCLNITSLCRDL
uniref:Uncharacterized protein n=1 Tax=Arundo donax TaxID=35708 RepID=A0A0A8ZK73_ARUDO